jgi:glutathione S-transferase
MEHGDFRLYETQAILRYVDAVCPGASLQPTEPRSAARMNQIIGVTDWYFFRDVSATIGFNRIVAPALGMPTDETVVLAAIPKAATCLKALGDLVGDNHYVAGDAMTIADLMLAPQMEFLAMTPEGETLLEPYPELKAWLARMQERPSMGRTTWKSIAQAA